MLSTTECVKGKLLGSSPVSVIVAVEFTGIEIDCDVDVGMLEETFKVIVPNGLYFVPLKTLKVKVCVPTALGSKVTTLSKTDVVPFTNESTISKVKGKLSGSEPVKVIVISPSSKLEDKD